MTLASSLAAEHVSQLGYLGARQIGRPSAVPPHNPRTAFESPRCVCQPIADVSGGNPRGGKCAHEKPPVLLQRLCEG